MADEKDGLMEKAVMGGVIALVMIVVMSQAVQAFPPAQPVAPEYCCPICPDKCYPTYEELYEHFTTAHPTQPIDIIWE